MADGQMARMASLDMWLVRSHKETFSGTRIAHLINAYYIDNKHMPDTTIPISTPKNPFLTLSHSQIEYLNLNLTVESVIFSSTH